MATTVKNFSPLSSFVPNSSFHFRRRALRGRVFAVSRFPQTFLRYYFLCYSIFVSTSHHTRVPCFTNSIHECHLVISYECRLFCFSLILLLNRWLELLKVLQDPWRPKNRLQLAFRPNQWFRILRLFSLSKSTHHPPLASLGVTKMGRSDRMMKMSGT
jgi:hypothetical protein